MPGSRLSEIKKITAPLLMAAELSNKTNNNLHFVSSFINEKTFNCFKEIKKQVVPDLNVDVHIDKTHRVMEAADIIMLAFGTATLEAMLFKKPMSLLIDSSR